MDYVTSNEWIYKIFLKWCQKHVFFIKDDEVWDKYVKVWDVMKNKLGINFHSKPFYEYRYLKAKVR